MSDAYYVYMMSSKTRVVYIGFTSNLPERVRQHKIGYFPGFSRKYNCHRLVYYEVYEDAETGISREKQLKGMSRRKKVYLLEEKNPLWLDLGDYEEWLRFDDDE